MLAEADRRASARRRRSAAAAPCDRCSDALRQIEAFAVEKVEHEVAEAVASGRALKSACSRAKLGSRRNPRPRSRRRSAPSSGPSVFSAVAIVRKARRSSRAPCACSSLTLLPSMRRLHAIAVVLDLVHPFRAARRLVGDLRQARLEEGRQDALARALHLAADRAAASFAPPITLARPAWSLRSSPSAASSLRRRPLTADVVSSSVMSARRRGGRIRRRP